MKTTISKSEIPTIEELNNCNSVYDAINFVNSKKLEYPSKPAKPRLKDKHTSEDVRAYTMELETYENVMLDYKAAMDIYSEHSSKLYKILEDHIKEHTGLNTIPEQYRDNVWSYAWEQGRSSGYSEVVTYLQRLIEIF